MDDTRLVNAKCFLAWKSADASHKDWQYFHKLDLWRDQLPGDLRSQFSELQQGDYAEVHTQASDLFPVNQQARSILLKRSRVVSAFNSRNIPEPSVGRFYPRGILSGIPGMLTTYPEDITPFRIIDMNSSQVEIDFNHPLCSYDLSIGIRLEEILPDNEQRGGHCHDIIDDIATHGSGMQCHLESVKTSYLQADSFSRKVETSDRLFYTMPRLVHHIDKQAISIIRSLYERNISTGMKVLDLMSSWESHLHEISAEIELYGLGMNEAELKANPLLRSYIIQDLNDNPVIPYSDNSVDIVICTVSIEYLIKPLQVFDEIARILKPGGKFIITFSDRWFPEKVIQIWTELHPYERMGLVLEYFYTGGQFTNLETESWHGWIRPSNDMYFPQKLLSDPVFGVMGTRI